MATRDTDEAGNDDPTDQRKVLMFMGIGVVTIYFILFDVVNWTNGGGLFSILSAIEAIQVDAGAIDIDGSGLLTLFIAIPWLIVVGVCIRLKIDVGNRTTITMIGLAIAVGSFILNATLGEDIIASFLQSHGYARCIARDHTVGHGKGQVWFQNYVHSASDCPPAQPYLSLTDLKETTVCVEAKWSRIDHNGAELAVAMPQENQISQPIDPPLCAAPHSCAFANPSRTV